MTKEDKIKEAYGEYWESVKLLTDENGFICQSTLFFPETVMMDKMEIQVKPFPPDGRCYWRPMTLKGIENNNGWIRIESENDLPKDKSIDVIVDSKPYQGFIYEANCGLFCCIENRYNQNELSEIIEANLITHYQPIFKPAIPLY